MAHIVAYHPEIVVQKDDELFAIKLDLDDWYSDEEILRSLAVETGAKTMGELVEILSAPKKKNSSARIEKVEQGRTTARYDWTDQI